MTTTQEVQAERNGVIAEVLADIQEKADHTKLEATAVIDHIFSGGDPRRAVDPKYGDIPWYNSGVRQYASHIVNAYRRTQGLPDNPYHPSQMQFRAFNKLTEKPGEWILGAHLTPGHRVEALLKPNELAKAGWLLAKDTIKGRVHFRLVRIEDDNAAG